MRPGIDRNACGMPQAGVRPGNRPSEVKAMRSIREPVLVFLFVLMLGFLLPPESGVLGGPDPQGRGYHAVTFYVA